MARMYTLKMRGIVSAAGRCFAMTSARGQQALGVYAPAIAPLRINKLFGSPSNHGSFNDTDDSNYYFRLIYQLREEVLNHT